VCAVYDDWKCNVRGEGAHRTIGNESEMCYCFVCFVSVILGI